MSASEFSRAELAAAFEKFEKTVARAAATRDWDCWVQHYTPTSNTSSTRRASCEAASGYVPGFKKR